MKSSLRRIVTFCLIGLAVLASWPAHTASAHPLGNFSINHYSRLEVAPGQIQTFYVVDLAEIPTFQLKKTIDANGDNQLDINEQSAYATQRSEALVKGLSLSVNDTPLAMTVRAPAVELSPGQGGLESLRLSFWIDSPLPANMTSPMRIAFNDSNDLDRLGWREIVVRAADGVSISNADVSDKDVSNELRTYPEDLLNQPLRETSATFEVAMVAGAGQVSTQAEAAQAPAASAGRDSEFSALINYRELTPSVILLSLLTALGLGALHALEPGHGKSLAAAYLVGTRATPKHAVILGSTVTVTHTFSVFLMGLVTLFLSSFIVPEKLFPYLGLLSAFIVIVMGIGMILNAVRQRRQGNVATDHTHEFDASTNQLVHAHGGKQHAHVPPSKMNARNVLAVGVSGGLVPCPAALIVLLSAIALGRVGFGMLLIVVFSLGLAGVLTGISLMLVYSKRVLSGTMFASKFASVVPGNGRLVRALPFVSGALVICAGFLLLYYAVPFLQLV
jgi:ABC-type nickel/cobalt efflux system permease component RcnA